MVTASISLRGVGRTFGATRALAGVDLEEWAQPAAWHAEVRRVRDGVEHAEPSLEDAYLLLLRGGSPEPETAEEAAS